MRALVASGTAALLLAAGCPAWADGAPAAPAPVATTPAPAPPAPPKWRGEVLAGGIILTALGTFLVLPGAWLATNELGDAAKPASAATRFAVLGVAAGLVVPGVTLALVGGLPRNKTAPTLHLGAGRASLVVRF